MKSFRLALAAPILVAACGGTAGSEGSGAIAAQFTLERGLHGSYDAVSWTSEEVMSVLADNCVEGEITRLDETPSDGSVSFTAICKDDKYTWNGQDYQKLPDGQWNVSKVVRPKS